MGKDELQKAAGADQAWGLECDIDRLEELEQRIDAARKDLSLYHVAFAVGYCLERIEKNF